MLYFLSCDLKRRRKRGNFPVKFSSGIPTISWSINRPKLHWRLHPRDTMAVAQMLSSCALGHQYQVFFVEEDEASLKRGMDSVYWVQAWSALVRDFRFSLAPP